MSSFYDDASLVVIPSGYKTSKVYAEKPTDGSGDLAFTRTGDTATRVNSAGLIEKVRTNLLTRSQEFDNAAWVKDRTTATANVTTAPDGTTTADKVVDTLQGNNAYRVYNGITLSAISYSASFYVKAAEYSWVYIRIGNSLRVWFNVSTGVVGNNDSGITGRIENAGNGWYRCTAIIATATAGGGFSLLGLTNANGVETYTPSTGGQGVFVWGAQLEATDFGATPYIVTTTAAVSVGPTANTARLDYLGSTCPRLLLEPQRTNLVTFSEQFNDASWSKNAVSVTANNAASPDGYTNADLVTADGTNAIHDVFKTFSGATSNSVSVFVKAGTGRYINLVTNYESTGTDWVSVVFDLQTQTSTVANEGNLSSSSVKIEAYGNGWYRLTSSTTAASAVTLYNFIGIVASANPTRNSGSRGRVIATSSGTFWFYGAQAEAGSYATSYIPTLAASVTRVADAASKTGISSLIGQTEGTIYAEIVRTQSTATDAFWIAINDNSANNWIFIGTEATGGRAYVRASNTVIFDQYPAISVGRHKLAIAYKSGSIAVYIDGTQLFTSSATFTIGSLTGLNLGSPSATTVADVNTAGAVNQALLFKTRLTNAEMASLTSL
jgi:hypothetical protein